MDVTHIIQAEHRQLERLFERFDRAARSADDRAQAELARQIVRELSLHAAVEEQVLYPTLSRLGVSAERLEALEEHHAVKLALSEIESMSPDEERFSAKMHVVERSVRQHVAEEESTLLPRLREAVEDDELQRLGREFEALRRSAPTRPHPASPDTPPANLFSNAAASLINRLRDALDDARGLLWSTARQVVGRSLRGGRDAAERTRRNGKDLLEQARATGERALDRSRMLGAGVVEAASARGAEVAERIERRTATAAHAVRADLRGTGARAHRTRVRRRGRATTGRSRGPGKRQARRSERRQRA